MIHILLINSNSIVSRLLTLCTREDNLVLEEVQALSSLQRKHYDIVFIDEASYKDDVLQLDRYLTSRQKILFSHDNNLPSSFDSVIQKPFLPFQIIDIIDSIPEYPNLEEDEQTVPKTMIDKVVKKRLQTQVLDETEIQKIKNLLAMEDEDIMPPTTILSEIEIEERKIEVIKEQLVSDGLEIVEEQEMIESFEPSHIDIDKKKDTKISMKKTKKQKNKPKTGTKKEHTLLKEALFLGIQGLSKKKIKKLLKGEKVKLTLQIEAL